MFFRWPLAAWMLALSFFAAPPGRADEVFTFVVKKQEQKQKTRWSLQEWLDTRDRMRLMDLWLALHSPSPYEFFLGGDYRMGDNTLNAWKVNFAAYASIFGLEVAREASSSGPDRTDWLGLFHLRLFGFQSQGTNLTLEGGLRSRSVLGTRRTNPVAGVDMTIYLTRFFGIEGLWRKAFVSSGGSGGGTYAGSRWEGSAFIDFRFVRIYGSYFSDTETAELAGATAESTWKGAAVGTRLYF
jgi:hypothetical protein